MKEMHYRCAISPFKKLVLRDRLELPPPDYKTGILPHEITEHNKTGYILDECSTNELITHKRNTGVEPVTYRLDSFAVCILKLVRGTGFEPATCKLATYCSTKLS